MIDQPDSVDGRRRLDAGVDQHPLAIIAPAVALVVVSLLFAMDWSALSGADDESDRQIVPVDDSNGDPTPASTSVVATTVPVDEPATSGFESTTSSTTGQPTIDELGADAVVAALAEAGFPDIQILIDGGTVTLRGRVPDAPSQRAVLNQVGQVAGVEAIVDELDVG